MLKREDPRDVLVYKEPVTLKELPQGLTIGTASLRRAAQVLHKRPDLKVVPLRGNVQTRLRKIAEGEADATLMACAGLKRLGLMDKASYIFELDDIIPAVGQGAIGVQCREDDSQTLNLLEQINHSDTYLCVQAERAYLQQLDGSCQTPIGGYANIQEDTLHMRGFLAQPDGSHTQELSMESSLHNPEALGVALANKLLGKYL